MMDIEKVKREVIEAMLSAPPKDGKCHCDMRTKLVGDGCSVCNPEYYAEMMEDEAD